MNNLPTYNDIAQGWFDFNISAFENHAIDIFRFQYQKNDVYKAFTDALKVQPEEVATLCDIPFLPIQFFKSSQVKTTAFNPEAIFESSGTTQALTSRHHVRDLSIYMQSFLSGFAQFYGRPEEWCILGLLPSYLERQNSSLVFMVNELIRQSNHVESGFYLYDQQRLVTTLQRLEKQKQKTLLIGVTFALLDFAEKYPMPLENTIIMETGGMKGRREEMTRAEIHHYLQNAFQVDNIHSEYGMTELLSQCYSHGNGIFRCPPWMKVVVRDEEDPLTIYDSSSDYITGAINVIDFANIYSCSFIATEDAGKLYHDGSFEILGRIDNSDIRGCSLLSI